MWCTSNRVLTFLALQTDTALVRARVDCHSRTSKVHKMNLLMSSIHHQLAFNRGHINKHPIVIWMGQKIERGDHRTLRLLFPLPLHSEDWSTETQLSHCIQHTILTVILLSIINSTLIFKRYSHSRQPGWLTITATTTIIATTTTATLVNNLIDSTFHPKQPFSHLLKSTRAFLTN